MKTVSEARILVVEDDENNRLVAVKLLELAGALISNIFATASDPLPYLQTMLPQGVDLILLDLQLPGRDGYEILKDLRGHPKFAHTLVVVLTANVMQQDVERVRAAGFDGFIGKPINGPRFKEWIQRILAGESVWTAVS